MNAKPADPRRRKTAAKRDVRWYAESQLKSLNAKIDKLLNKLDEKEQDEAKTPEEECVICVNSKATMQTWPCGHRVVCRRCLVRTIQMAVSRRSLPLRCVVCRARVLRLKRSSDGTAVAATDDRRGDSSDRPAAGRSYSLPVKLRRGAAAAVAPRSRSVGTDKTPGHGRRPRRRTTGGGGGGGVRRRELSDDWADPLVFADEDGERDRCDDDDDDGDTDDGHRSTAAVKHGKLDKTDRRCNNQSKNGLQKVLGALKFWKFLRFKNSKP